MIPVSVSMLCAIINIILFSFFTLITLKINPRIMLHNYPNDIQSAVKPKDEREKKNTKLLSIIFIVLFAGTPLIMTFIYVIKNTGSISFPYYLIHFLIIMQLTNLNDLFILDWLIFCTITPKFIIIPGTEGNQGYKNYKYHFIPFLKGLIVSGIFSVLFALVCYFWDRV